MAYHIFLNNGLGLASMLLLLLTILYTLSKKKKKKKNMRLTKCRLIVCLCAPGNWNDLTHHRMEPF